ncbi:MAG: amylo-alpha-1,6-glucosidase [Planctomycetota bacterium]|jgi:predicted glycogen debranching enzyme
MMKHIEIAWEKPDLDDGLAREFFDAAGNGGYAAASVMGTNTRRYHGLLVADLGAPLGRIVTLSRLEETLVSKGAKYDLATNHYPGTIHPKGYQYIYSFRQAEWPVTVFKMPGVVLEKHVFMVHGENTVVVFYMMPKGRERMSLRLRPMLAFRNYHSLTHENTEISRKCAHFEGGFRIKPYASLPQMTIFHNAGSLKDEYFWYNNYRYDLEKQRGLDYDEDLFSPIELVFEIEPGDTAWIAATIEEGKKFDFEKTKESELARRRKIFESCSFDFDWAPQVAAAAEAVRVKTKEGRESVYAGYPWFVEWGRDAMISVPGLYLARGLYKKAAEVLLRFASGMRDGLIPNYFPEDSSEPEYTTVDASLWFVHALAEHYRASGDRALLEELFPKAVEIVESYIAGTANQIKMESDGLIRHGPRLTWMDAKVGDWVVTPRAGKAVEISALWFNAVASLAEMSEALGGPSDKCMGLLPRIRRNFIEKFHFQQGGYLYDVLDERYIDTRIRPNQLLAVSLPYSPLPAELQRAVVDTVTKRLLVPGAVRSLAVGDEGYQGCYIGDQTMRDAAYHQGTAWPWLLAPYARAYIRVRGYDAPWLHRLLEPVPRLLERQAVGNLPEVLDGDPPHTPRGAFAQAWSVAAVLEMLGMLKTPPKFLNA